MSYLATTDYLIEVGKGNVPGEKIVAIPGLHNANIETTQYGDISLIPSVVILPTPTGIGLELISSSANDTAAGTGIQSVDIHYLDATTFLEKTETVAMNGLTAVVAAETNFGPIQWIHAQTVGAGEVAAGNISLQTVGGGTVYEYLAAGGNQSLSSRYTIPADKTGIMLNWHVSGMRKRIDFQLRATCDRLTRTLLPGVFLFQDTESCESSTSGLLDGKGMMYPSKCVIKVSATAAAVGGEGASSFTLLLVDN